MNGTIFSKELELRHLTTQKQLELAKILDVDDSILSLLMGNIVKLKNLDNDNDDSGSELRFSSIDIDQLREHSIRHNKSAILVLLDEWSTMGRIRPKVKHLLSLLIKCQLYKAADYVAELIGEDKPERPTQGPSAKVDISLPNEEIERVVDNFNYPFSSINLTRINRINYEKPAINTPDMNFVNEISDNGNNQRTTTTASAPSVLFAQQQPQNLSHELEISNLIKFSTSFSNQIPIVVHENIAPHSSTIMRNSIDIPMTVNSSNDIPSQSFISIVNIPALSGLMSSNNSSESQSDSENLPACLQSMEIKSNSENALSNEGVPDFSGLMNNSTQQTFSDVSESQSMTQSSISSIN